MHLFIQLTLLIAAYLLGSIPWGFVLGKMKGIDIREHGSKNIGATNTGRVLGRRYAVIAYVLDLFKGFIFVGLFTFHILDLSYCLFSPMVYGLAAVLGHTFPIYLKFKGGKAVATGGGVFLAYAPLLFLSIVAFFFIITFLFKYVSLGSLLSAFVTLISSFVLFLVFPVIYDWTFPLGIFIIVLIIFIRHKSNIVRILHKEESKVKWRKEKNTGSL